MKKHFLSLISSLLFLIPVVAAQRSNPSGWAIGPFGGMYDVLVITVILIVTAVVVGIGIILKSSNKKKGFWIFKK